MAKNRVFAEANFLSLDVSGVTGTGVGGLVQSGDPVAVGELVGVALTDEDSDGNATVQLNGAFELEVEETLAAGIAVGDPVYYQTDGDIDDVNTGVRFGVALGAVPASSSATIPVRIGY